MAVTRGQYSIVFTALNDAVPGPIFVHEISFEGEGLTIGDNIVVQDTAGNEVGSHAAVAAAENAELLFPSGSPRPYNGLKITTVPSTGTWKVTAQIR